MLRKNVASQVLTFDLVNATTGAALTGATVTTKVTLDGTQSAGAGTVTELGTGQYKYVPTQGETNGTSVGFSFTATNACPVNLHCFTVAFDPTDAVRAGLTALPNAAAEAAGGLYTRGTGAGQINQPANGMVDANVVRNAGTAITSAAGVQEVKVASIAANAITATSIAADAITDAKVASDVTIASVTGAVGSVTGAVGSVTGSVGSIATGGISAASFAAGAIDAAAIAADAIGSSELAASAITEIQSGLSTLDAAAVATATQTGMTAQGYTSTRAGYLDTLNGLAAAVWAAATSGLTTVGSIGKLLVDNVNATISSRLASASYTAPLDAAATRTALGLASANLDTQLDALPTAAETSDAVWDEVLSGHLTSGTTGAGLNAAGSAGDPWATSVPGAYGAGTAGKILGDNLDAAISTRLASAGYTAPPSASTVASQVRTELTTELGRVDVAVSTRLASSSYTAPLDAAGVRTAVGLASANLDTQLSAIAGYIDTEVAAILTKIGTPSADLAADIAAIYAKVDTEVAAILAAVDTEVAAIKAKTDNLTFTSGTDLDVNVQKVNDVALTGVGTSGDPWGPV